ncbi:hypothetical protein Scep_020334 [Stephania cephalantha]|uniref:Alpha/beta hydrolase fold-3 domain-containing protein n=1 Tax=Stephania cephalantha TaxID=152367 RepID=A0AAP0ICZ2_9MAGN
MQSHFTSSHITQPKNSEVESEFHPFFCIYKDGTVERFMCNDFSPPSTEHNITNNNISSKDVVIDSQTGLSARLYLPIKQQQDHDNNINNNIKLPLLIYFHGGGFCVGSPFTSTYHNYLNEVVHEANVVAISVNYRLAPEHPIPCAYEDSWTAIQWAFSHSNGCGEEAWLNQFASFERVFMAGDSAGANIAHHMAMRIGKSSDGGKLVGIALVHPYFLEVCSEDDDDDSEGEGFGAEEKAMAERMWYYAYPSTTGLNDRYINPVTGDGAENLIGLGGQKVIVFVAEKDFVGKMGRAYGEKLRESGWSGEVEILESEGEGHVFHLFDPCGEKALLMKKRFASFLNQK